MAGTAKYSKRKAKGVSTADGADDVAGRGVGGNVVKRAVDRLTGVLDLPPRLVDLQPEVGTQLDGGPRVVDHLVGILLAQLKRLFGLDLRGCVRYGLLLDAFEYL